MSNNNTNDTLTMEKWVKYRDACYVKIRAEEVKQINALNYRNPNGSIYRTSVKKQVRLKKEFSESFR